MAALQNLKRQRQRTLVHTAQRDTPTRTATDWKDGSGDRLDRPPRQSGTGQSDWTHTCQHTHTYKNVIKCYFN